jgi:hypothetical protein
LHAIGEALDLLIDRRSFLIRQLLPGTLGGEKERGAPADPLSEPVLARLSGWLSSVALFGATLEPTRAHREAAAAAAI